MVLCFDEKSQIQALERTSPMLPMQPHQIERHTHDYTHHGTTIMFAALKTATGQVTAALKPRHRRQEFLAFLRQIDRACPGQELHLVMDSCATHKTPEVKAWLAAHPRIEVWFGIIDRQAIRRGASTSVKDLNQKICQLINGWNNRSHLFIWT